VTPLLDVVRDSVRAEGPITFARYMELALYHPEHGYYAGGAPRTGWNGHFVTSPELDPAFGALWARAAETVWRACGLPARFEVVEVGPGEGGFAAAFLGAAPAPLRAALAVTLVEPIPALRARQRRRLEGLGDVRWVRDLDAIGRVEHGCIFCNEVLDNQPVHLVERAGGRLREVMVDAAPDGSLRLAPRPPAAFVVEWMGRHRIHPPEGARAEVPVAAERLVGRAARALARGAVVLVDYGTSGERNAAGTLLTYGAGGPGADLLADPGARDITAHVDWRLVSGWLVDAGLRPAGPRPQREVLKALGARDLERALAAESHSARGARVVRALSRRQALAALLDPAGLGGLDVVLGCAGIPPPAFMADQRDGDRP
jgi:SAM-dependent MidA family methyltransferase